MSRILLVDSYDSFTHNLAALFFAAIPDVKIHIIKNDLCSFDHIRPYLVAFSAIVAGPGPGSPLNDKDVGVLKHLFRLPTSETPPIFGVCLGLQSLAVEHGASIHRLNVVKHGQITPLFHSGEDLFSSIGRIDVTRYHSLHVKLEDTGDLEELAYVEDGCENGRVTMAIRHKSKPIWAVQYHPESVKTNGGLDVIANFWRLAQDWSARHERNIAAWTPEAEATFGPSWPSPRTHSPSNLTPIANKVLYQRIDIPNIYVPAICEALNVKDHSLPFVLLDSAASPGRFSIIGCLHDQSIRLTYNKHNSFIDVHTGQTRSRENLNNQDVWSWASTFMQSRRFVGGDPSIPFWGGLVGFISYEMGVHGLGVSNPSPWPSAKQSTDNRHPDVNLVYVERSVVYDKHTGALYIQSLLPDDEWISDTTAVLVQANISSGHKKMVPQRPNVTPAVPRLELPDKDLYLSRIRRCKEYLASGDSYELCLTARTRITLPSTSSLKSSWDIYKSARRCNPAPYSAYFRLHPSTVISSSPERFLSFTRPPNMLCQLRPIKGTLRKTSSTDRVAAERLLAASNKEVAENLMIVDLIRHDLHGVLGPDVNVTQFCGIEEYETVWQMVSVIEGRPNNLYVQDDTQFGWEVLRSSLPPGSMTGAPKKRSVEILQTLEDDERGVYSGVLGYWDVGGGGDWAVTIRACFKYEDELCTATENNTWITGAGGAITALSDPEAEWEEMLLKLQGVLSAFHTQ